MITAVANFDQKNLKALKKQLGKKQTAEKEATQEILKQQVHDNRDHDYFRDAMDGVNPLEKSRAYHEVEKPSAKLLKHQTNDELRYL